MKKTKKKTKNTGKKPFLMPLADRVLIKVDDGKDEKKNEFGIIIPDTVSKERPEQGKIIAVGEGKINDEGSLIPMRVKVGDKVIFSKYGFDEIKVDGEEFILVNESNILAVIK